MMRSVLRILFSFDNVMIVLGTVGLAAAFYFIPQNFNFLDPIGQALGDMDITDMAFSQFRDEEKMTVDTNIVIVNIGLTDRSGIADIINNLNRFQPAVIGVDAFFRNPKDEWGDSLLRDALENTENLVLVSKVAFKEESREGVADAWAKTSEIFAGRDFDTLETSHPMFMEGARTGYSNLIINQEVSFMTCREVSFSEQCSGKTENSFAIELAKAKSPAKAQVALMRGNVSETINFRGNVEKFYSIDVDQAIDTAQDLSFIRNKVVLCGYMGPELGTHTLDDNFFTPLNEHYVGRSYPDMYGVVIHANTVSMILNGSYIEVMPFWLSMVVGFSLLVVNVMMLTFMYRQFEAWYDLFAVTVQLGESLLILFLIVSVFANSNYKLALTPALFGVFLVGTVHDLYQDSLKKVIVGWINRFRMSRSVASSQRKKSPNDSTT